MRDAAIEGAAQDSAAILENVVTAEVLPKSERDSGEIEATEAAATVGHWSVAIG
jgi:hypothetical protein